MPSQDMQQIIRKAAISPLMAKRNKSPIEMNAEQIGQLSKKLAVPVARPKVDYGVPTN